MTPLLCRLIDIADNRGWNVDLTFSQNSIGLSYSLRDTTIKHTVVVDREYGRILEASFQTLERITTEAFINRNILNKDDLVYLIVNKPE